VPATVADDGRDLRAETATARARSAEPGAILTLQEAATYLRMSVRLLQDRADVPRHDIRPPGSRKAQWRFLRAELDAWVVRCTYGGYRHENA
jgi:hypothetical protein